MSKSLIALAASFAGTLLVSCGGDEYVEPTKEKYTVAYDRDGTVADAVDLGLSSGRLWAAHNVGASSPEETGNYFAWAMQQNVDTATWDNYKYATGVNHALTKYCSIEMYGYEKLYDFYRELESSDDAVIFYWNRPWRTPTQADWQELLDECDWSWVVDRSADPVIRGYKVVGPNGNSIFLPVAGHLDSNMRLNRESFGYYWSATLNADAPSCAFYLHIGLSYHSVDYAERYLGFSLRAVQ